MISIIIRTYNEQEFLSQLLDQIERQDIDQEFEIIVVDSGSTDGTLSIAKKYNTKIIEIKKEDFTFGRSLNYGCRAAQGDYFVFISAHCIPVNNLWLKNLIEPLKKSGTALSYGRQIGDDLSKFSEHQVFSKYFPENKDYQQGGYFCNNANSAIKKSLWLKYHFDENLTGLEDLDWAKHWFQLGYKITYVPEANIFHIHQESWRKVKLRYEREAYALKEIMPEIHFNLIDFFRSLIRGILNDVLISLKEGHFIKSFTEILFFRFCQFYGAYKGHHIHRKLSKQKKQNYFYP